MKKNVLREYLKARGIKPEIKEDPNAEKITIKAVKKKAKKGDK